MPFVRCKFYTESGDPVGAGCHRKGAGCTFIHPDDPNWVNAREPSSRARDKNSDAGKPWDRGKRGAPPPESDTSATDTGGGWDTGGAASAPESMWSKSQSSWGDHSPANKLSQTDATSASTTGGQGGWGGGWGNTEGGGWGASGWGNDQNADKTAGSGTGSTGDGGWGSLGWGNDQSADKTAGSGTGSTGDNGWGASGWGNNQDTDRTAVSGTGNAGDSGWGSSSWGDKKDADKNTEPTWGSGWGSGWGNKDDDKNTGSAWGNVRNDGGSGWGNVDNTTSSRTVSRPMVMDGQAEKASGHSRGAGKAVIPPPRIRIPDNENKKAKLSGTNNEPLGSSKWGESRPTTSTPVTMLTPLATSTPTEPTHGKRKRDTALDDKFELFKEYVKTWERAVRAKFLLAEAEAKHDRWRRTQKSACYARIGEAGRDRLDGQRIEFHKEHTTQWEKLSSAVSLLMEFHEKLASNLDLGQRYNVGEETQKFISESKAFVDETRALLVARILKEKDEGQQGDIEEQPSDTAAISVDSLRGRISHLEERFERAQTELTLRQQYDIRLEIDEILTAKIQALRTARQQEIDRVASKPRPEIVIPSGALRNMEGTAQQVSEMEMKVPHTVEDIRVLLFRVDTMTKRVSQLEEEVSMNKETYRKVEGIAAEKEEAERQIDQKLKNIQEQFQQLVASQSPPLAAQMPTAQDLQDRLMENLRPVLEAVLAKFYEVQVRPAVEAMQELVINESNRHQEEAIRVLWGRMKPAMSMVEGVSRWLDSYELGLTAPVEADC